MSESIESLRTSSSYFIAHPVGSHFKSSSRDEKSSVLLAGEINKVESGTGILSQGSCASIVNDTAMLRRKMEQYVMNFMIILMRVYS